MRLGRLAGLAVLSAGMMTGCVTAYPPSQDDAA